MRSYVFVAEVTFNENYIYCWYAIIFQNNCPVYVGHKSSKKHFKLIWKDLSDCIYRQLNCHQHRIRSETGISLEIILNVFKCLAVSLSTQIFILAIAPLSFISVSIFCEFAMLPDVYILLAAHPSKRLNPSSAVILVWLGNTSKK